MEIFTTAFNTILYQPLLNALVFLYQYLPGQDFGVAVIVLTLIIRFALYPLMLTSIKSQKMLTELQPKIQEIQQRNKDNKEKQAQEMMKLYQEQKINPFGGCLPLLLQLPILFALYRVFWHGFEPEAMSLLYSFVPNPGVIDPNFLGFLNLSQPSLVLAVLAGIFQFIQTKMMAPKHKPSTDKGQMSEITGAMQKQMIYFLPLFTVMILFRLPSAIGLYWIVTAVFSIGQQYLVLKPSEQKNA
jgi:YidC/Oxa1 family membrane protein insertase